jgi:hypothetical protein
LLLRQLFYAHFITLFPEQIDLNPIKGLLAQGGGTSVGAVPPPRGGPETTDPGLAAGGGNWHFTGVDAIVSGDHKQPTKKLAKELGMDDYFYDNIL